MNVDYVIRDNVRQILIECRKEKGISQEELARQINSKPTTVASWELGNKGILKGKILLLRAK